MPDALDRNFIKTQFPAFGAQDQNDVSPNVGDIFPDGPASTINENRFQFRILAKNTRIHTNE